MVRALVADGRGSAAFADVPEPAPQRGEVVVELTATSLNRGELTRLKSAPAGWAPGWDFAGRLAAGVAGGPPAGTRVVGILAGGAWRERVAVPAAWVAVLPQGVTDGQAAALPTAALTALRMLRLGRGMLGRRVAITGASSGVGRFAVQLARLAGAEVHAVAGSPERAEGARALGAQHVATDVRELAGPYDLVLDAVGGESLVHLALKLTQDGLAVVYGNSSNSATTFPEIRDFYLGGARRLQAFTLFHAFPSDPPGRDLAYLAGLVASGQLDPHVSAELSWKELDQALERLAGRAVGGKLVLRVD